LIGQQPAGSASFQLDRVTIDIFASAKYQEQFLRLKAKIIWWFTVKAQE
jgi:hypothetical protein